MSWSRGLVLAGVLLAGCRREVRDEQVVARARAALAPLKVTLKSELQSALSESPEHAIDVCSKRAQQLAIDASKDGVVVGRSGKKLRNPANAPREWLAPVIDRLTGAKSGSDAHEVVRLPDGRYGYAEAIWIAPPCLTCHGESIAPPLAQKLDALYPNDTARGFVAGDFRGVFWAELLPLR